MSTEEEDIVDSQATAEAELRGQAAALKDLQGVVEQIKRFKDLYIGFQKQIDELKERSSGSSRLAGGARRGGGGGDGTHGTVDFSGITNGAEGNQEEYGGYPETGADVQQGGGDEYGAADGDEYGELEGAGDGYDAGLEGAGGYDAGLEGAGGDGYDAGEHVGDGAGDGVGGIQAGGAPVAKKVKKSTKTKKTKTKKAKKAAS